ncbi:hypothetical protein HN51_027490 [Arachis hypogaea]|uniref:11 kDa late embryogenesis abundant protein n=2 Tax=Arachis TaxID=3817 RepID=A0A6P4BAK8_ARADU|nr:11 kDa late embryogenesis abundant protein [Arachis duranensis]XP_025618368.1 11 kDa late embryogenesis abundant protein [Arachis hypogaea]QHO33858.1 18 kDa seed maturation protein [Arachis hypogaea]
MQATKKAVENAKETAANIGASAKSGLEKTKATVTEKAEKISTHDPIQKEMATHKKEEKIQQADMEKHEAREHNAAAKISAMAGHMDRAPYSTTGPATKSTDVNGPGSEPAGDGQPMARPTTGMGATAAHGKGSNFN